MADVAGTFAAPCMTIQAVLTLAISDRSRMYFTVWRPALFAKHPVFETELSRLAKSLANATFPDA